MRINKNMDLLEQTRKLCQLYNIKPSRSKGQNFLVNNEVYDEIIEAADLHKDDVVLEVGPGLGFLTVELAKRVKKVIAVELDDRLAEILRRRLSEKGIGSRRSPEAKSGSRFPLCGTSGNVDVVNENILTSPPRLAAKRATPLLNRRGEPRRGELKGRGYKIVANLPYNITSVFLRKFLATENRPELMVLMLQKEVAERIVAKPGKMSLLAVSVQFYARPEIVQIVPADNFWPQPKVDSEIIKIVGTGHCPVQNEKDFFRLVKIGFSAKRKMLKNNLANGYHIGQQEAENRLEKAGFSAKVRAQELSVKDWVKLFEQFK